MFPRTKTRQNNTLRSTFNRQHRQKILILGDSHVRNTAKILQSTMDKDVYSAQAICKPNATFKDIVNDIANLTRDFTEHDFVIIQAVSNDVLKRELTVKNDFMEYVFMELKRELVKNDFMEYVFMELAKTNVIFLSIPYWSGRSVLNNLIYDYNCRVYNIIQSFSMQNISFVETNRVLGGVCSMRDGLH
ncbi:hypothetical protein QE152_g15205 [Popillia japonica]|uniref:SGNH/GDSL hydrolase family protein n=1 Tax=Popillia japonica TaxID=7064 RepID=A0AAW1L7V6_POPJA